jgi:hypothetical protein
MNIIVANAEKYLNKIFCIVVQKKRDVEKYMKIFLNIVAVVMELWIISLNFTVILATQFIRTKKNTVAIAKKREIYF